MKELSFTERFRSFAVSLLLSISESALRTHDPYESAEALLSIQVAKKQGVRAAIAQSNRLQWLKIAQCYWLLLDYDIGD